MTSIHYSSFQKQRFWLMKLSQSNPVLAISTIIYMLLFLACLILYNVDSRLVAGSPVWLKPLKFAISFAIYSATLLCLMSFLPKNSRSTLLIKILSWFYAVTAFIEVGLITLQAARAVPSHFNVSNALDTRIYELMGFMVIGIWSVSLIISLLFFFHKSSVPILDLSIRLAFVITLFSMLLATAMLIPSSEQRVQANNGIEPQIIGTHSIGVTSECPEMIPFLGWNKEAGDLRVSHFIGIHTLQFLPLVAFLILRFLPHLQNWQKRNLIYFSAFGYLGIVLITFWQAKRGQSILQPDLLTVTTFLLLLLGLLGALAATLRNRPRQHTLNH